MNEKHSIFVIFLLLFITFYIENKISQHYLPSTRLTKTTTFIVGGERIASCSIFSISIDDKAYYGNSEDYSVQESFIWFDTDGLGSMFVGFDLEKYGGIIHFGGLNSAGLALDMNGLPKAPLNPRPDLLSIGNPVKSVLLECSTVAEAIQWCQTHNFGDSFNNQIHLADATGAAVVVSAGPDQELAFTRKGNNDYLISTNFNLANPENGYNQSRCHRYDVLITLLNRISDSGYENLTIHACQQVLPYVRAENTQYTTYYNLKTQEIYLHYKGLINSVYEFNLTEELSKGYQVVSIPDLFSSIEENTTTTITSTTATTSNTATASNTTGSNNHQYQNFYIGYLFGGVAIGMIIVTIVYIIRKQKIRGISS